MAGIYIPNAKLPSGIDSLIISADGQVYFVDYINPYRVLPEKAIPVSDHGDLIERNKLYEKTVEWEAQALHMVEVTMHDEDATEWRKWSTVLTERSAFKFDVADAPTIIPADKEK